MTIRRKQNVNIIIKTCKTVVKNSIKTNKILKVKISNQR